MSTKDPEYLKYTDKSGRQSFAKVLGRSKYPKDFTFNVWILPDHNFVEAQKGVCVWPSEGMEEISEEEYLIAEIIRS